jgi:hypothetical protein
MKASKLFNFRSSLIVIGTSVLTLTSPFASAATETFNTAGTFNWVCPGGVTSVQVECWGGGGAGGGPEERILLAALPQTVVAVAAEPMQAVFQFL